MDKQAWLDLIKIVVPFLLAIYVPILKVKFQAIWAVKEDTFWFKVRGCFLAIFSVLPAVAISIWKNFGDTILTLIGFKKAAVTIARKAKK
jgi:type III secretory pathway component EscS